MALLAAMVAKRVSCSMLRPLSLGLLTCSLFDGVWSRALFASAHSTRRMLALPPTYASTVGACLQSRLHSNIPLLLAGDSNIWFSFFHIGRSFQIGRSRQADAPLLPIVHEILQVSFPDVSELPTNRCDASLLPPAFFRPHFVFLSSPHSPFLSLSPRPAHPPSLPRVRDWSTVVASCHHSLSVWHQSVLAHVSCPLPDFSAHASTLDSLFTTLPKSLRQCISSLHRVSSTHQATSLVERCVLPRPSCSH